MTKKYSWMACGLQLLAWLTLAGAALAHGTSKGDLRVDHAYAAPSVTLESEPLVYFRGIRNDAHQADRLLSASTPVAAEVTFQRVLQQGSKKVAFPLSAIELPATSITPMRHNKGEYQMRLRGLRQALKDGDRFELTLTFEHAGTLTTNVWVQDLGASANEEHKH